MIAALRWDPHADWIFAACDMPLLDAACITWLLAQRAPGRWAVIPRREDGACEPLAAWYDARMLPLLEKLDRPVAAAEEARVHTPALPGHLAVSWRSFNSPEDLEDL
jgi:molybdopterin-guanine dinucleotide biosynthesis protein A